MADYTGSSREDLLQAIISILGDLRAGSLDVGLPSLEQATTEAERDLILSVRELISARRRLASKILHLAGGLATAANDLGDRMAVAARANAEVSGATESCEHAVERLSDTSVRVSKQAGQLHRLIEQVAEATSSVAESGQEVTRNTETLSGAVGDVATAATSIAAAMREIDRSLGGLATELSTTRDAVSGIDESIRKIDAGTSETSELSDQMTQAAGRGSEVVRQTAEAVEAINSAIEGLGRSMERLEARSDEVTEITKLIQAIAIQAKLLALNASIQAAHAGEAGRGFAVVAREIKQLSDSTTASTRNIESVVRAIRSEIAVAAEEARTSGERAQGGLSLAHAARGALEVISEEVGLIRSRVQQISDATSAQARETANLKRAVGKVTELAEKLRRTAGERNEAAQRVVHRVREISKLAEKVRKSMSDQEQASLGIVGIIDQLLVVAGELEQAENEQSAGTVEMANAVEEIRQAGARGNASVASMAYTRGLVERYVADLREQLQHVRLPKPRRGGHIRIPLTTESIDCDPVRAYDESNSMILNACFERLVASEEGGEIVPQLAERYTVSPDGLHYTFHLRPGVVFHHGREVTSDDVRFSLERLARESHNAAFVVTPILGTQMYCRGEEDHIIGIRTPDPLTVEIELRKPLAFFPGLLALNAASILPRDCVETDPEGFGRAPVGSGPFRVVSVGDVVKLSRFEAYRDPDIPYLDSVDFVLNQGPDEGVAGVLDGSYAFTKFISREQLAEIKKDRYWRGQLQSTTQPYVQYLLFNNAPGRMADITLRRAISRAFDRSRALRAHLEVGSVLAEGLLPPSCPGFDPSLRAPSYDPELARQLIAQSGYDTSRAIEFVRTDRPWGVGSEAAEAMAEDFATVGLRLETRVVTDIGEARESGQYDIIEAGWHGDYLDPDTFTFGVFHSRFGAFAGLAGHPELDRLFEEARASTDVAGRAALYGRIHQLFFDICPAIVMFHGRHFVLQGRDLNGLRLYSLLPTVRLRDLWLEGNGN
jgi:ABC-type transport system substrate-binding protein